MKYILLFILLVLIILLLIINYKENLNNCEIINCGDIKDVDKCLSCDNCGIYTDRRDYKYCVNGDKDKPLFLKNWKSWQYLDNPVKYNLNSPSPKLYDKYTQYLDSLDNIYNNTPMSELYDNYVKYFTPLNI